MEGLITRVADNALPWLAAASAVSLVLLLAGALVGVGLVLRLPEDHLQQAFNAPQRQRHWAAWIARNLVAALLLVAGLLMLFLPGQGLLTILSALIVADFPGKRRLERRVLGSAGVLRLLNRVRRGGGRGPLKPP